MVNVIKETSDVCFHHIIRFAVLYHLYDFPYCLMAVSFWSEPKAFIVELWLINLLQYLCDCIPHQFILITGYPQWSHFAFCLLGNINSSCRIGAVTAILHSLYKILKVFL